MLISVITVCLNASDYIEQTITSVLWQTYPNLEYIIIDGGSDDGTVEVIRKYEAHLAYWHSKPDSGLAHAFNLGLAQARGEWILFLNADDYFSGPQVVESMIPQLTAHGDAEVIFGRVALAPRQQTVCPEAQALCGRDWQWRQFRFICTIPHQAAFTSRKYFERAGLFNEKLRIAMEYEHYLRAGADLRTVYVDKVISIMRRGGLSLNNVSLTLKEWRIAQTINRSASYPLIWANYVSRLCWYHVKKVAGIK
ncbi:MAG: glycosyltransferase [Deltaproteobacteria bacterium]|nr:glycosyltransferase [Deltaproteobacteria bacterium]